MGVGAEAERCAEAGGVLAREELAGAAETPPEHSPRSRPSSARRRTPHSAVLGAAIAQKASIRPAAAPGQAISETVPQFEAGHRRGVRAAGR